MLYRVAVMLGVWAVAAGAAQVTLDQASLIPGTPANLNMRLTRGADQPTGLQFDLEYDPNALEIKVEAGPAAGDASKNVQSRVLQPGKTRVLIIGFNRNVIADGVVAVLHVSLKGEAEAGKVFPVHITAPSGTNERAEKVEVTGKDGSLKVEVRRVGL